MVFKNGFKLVYEKLGKLFASKTGLPSDADAAVEIKAGDEDVLGTEETAEDTGTVGDGEQTQSLSAAKSRKKKNSKEQ